MHARSKGRRAGVPWLSAALALAPSLLAGCQSYEPRPLAPEVHRAAWHERALEERSLRAFLEELGHEAVADAPFDPDDGLALEEGLLVALVFNPGLRLARLEAERVAAGAALAGRWADPQLQLNLFRVAESVPHPWVVTPAIPFSIPLSGRTGAQADLARAEARAAARRVVEAEWALERDVRALWASWSAARLRAGETERFIESMRALVQGAEDLAARGELPATEAALFAIERAQLANGLARLRGEARAREAELRTLLGLAPEAPVRFEERLAAEASLELLEVTREELARRNPTLARLREEYEAAEEELRLQIARQYPDLQLGPQVDQDQDQTRIGLIAGVPLPVFNANRRAIAEARVARELARAAHETAYERLVGRRVAARARLAAVEAQREDLETVLAPMVERQLDSALRLARLGEGSSLVLLQSLVRAQETRLELIDVRAEEAAARSELAFLTGPPEDPLPAKEPERDE